MIYASGDNPADVLDKAACVVAFLTEALTDGRGPQDGIRLTAEALAGLALVTKALHADLRQAAAAE
ncbi:hypothetical protein [Megalodesulfovibrio gigas]|uniref:hypothetical protein n=1 Tax=Megalodesulfovibrio gigas TaxID=879 RepID=UPI0003FD812F|nr:hypothetical protein [Megalodesulfovibrio gigas]